MLAYSYKRFSFHHQQHGDSIRRQEALIKAYCSDNNLTLSEENFEDLGVSAFRSTNSKEDSGLGRFLLALEEGKLKTPCYLLVESLDRLSRDNIETALTQFMNIIQRGVTIVTLFDNRVYSKGMGMVDYILALSSMERANEESRTKSQRIKAVWKAKQEGINTKRGAACPFWLTVSGCKTLYHINEKVHIIQRIYSLAREGLGCALIARKLNSEGVLSPRGKKWSDTTISRLLRSRTVLGEYQPMSKGKVSGTPLKGFYPAVITEEDYHQTQAVIRGRTKSKSRNASNSFLNVIKGVGSCEFCGSPLRLKTQEAGTYLQCSVYHLRTCSKGKPFNIRYLQDWIREFWLTDAYTPVVIQDTREVLQLQKAEEKLEAINEVLRKLVELLDDNDDVIFERVRAKKVEKAEVISEIDRLKENLTPFNITKEALWKRFTVVKLAFMQGNGEEQIKARNQLANLLNQLKTFKVGIQENRTVRFTVEDYKGSIITYKSKPNAYNKSSKGGKIWTIQREEEVSS